MTVKMASKYLGVGLAVAGVSTFGIALHMRRKRRSELHSFSTMARQYVEFFILYLFGARVRKNLETDTVDFGKVQEKTLIGILKNNACTEYGLQYKFDAIQNKEQYVALHPLTRYGHYKDYIGEI